MNYLSEKKSTIKTPSKSANLADIEFPVYFGYLHCATYSELCDDCINLVSQQGSLNHLWLFVTKEKF